MGPRKIGRTSLCVTLDPRTVERIDQLSKELGISRGRVIDDAVILALLAPKVCPICEDAHDRGDGRCERHGRLLQPLVKQG